MRAHIQRTLARTVTGALVCASAVAASGAHGVALSETGTGQVLLYPYYTVRGTGSAAFNTLLSVVNTANDTKAVRVRFREGKNGRPVANFNVYLAPSDVWTLALTPSESSVWAISRDTSCMISDPATIAGAAPFFNYDYSGVYADGEDASPDRAREGFFEAIEMGVVNDGALSTAIRSRACSAVVSAQNSNRVSLSAPTGGLAGSASLINVAAGVLYSFEPTVLDGFSAAPLYAPEWGNGPTLADVNPKTAVVHEQAGVRITHWDSAPADPVSAVLMRQSLLNEFVLDPPTASSTVWVVTMPTKHHHVTTGPYVRSPFQSRFARGGAPESFGLPPGACATTNVAGVFDREARVVPSEDCGFLPPYVPPFQLPWQTSVINFVAETRAANLLSSGLAVDLRTPGHGGWARVAPNRSGTLPVLVSSDSPRRVYYGLPMIGFMANDFRNNTLSVPGIGTVLSNYGQTSPHRSVVRAE